MIRPMGRVTGREPHHARSATLHDFRGVYSNPGNDPNFACSAFIGCRGTGRERLHVRLNSGGLVIVRRRPARPLQGGDHA